MANVVRVISKFLLFIIIIMIIIILQGNCVLAECPLSCVQVKWRLYLADCPDFEWILFLFVIIL